MNKRKSEKNNRKYFILNLFAGASGIFRSVSPLTLLKRAYGSNVPVSAVPKIPEEKEINRREATITEKYTLSLFLFVMALWLIFFLFDTHLSRFDFPHLTTFMGLFAFWAFFRIFEIMSFHFDALLFEGYRQGRRVVRNADRYLVLMLINFGELVFLFAFVYRCFSGSFGNATVNVNPSILFLGFSFFVMTSFGWTPLAPINDFGYILMLAQSVVGVFMVLLAVAFATSTLRKPRILDEDDKT